MLKGGLLLIWELHMNLVLTLVGKFMKIRYHLCNTSKKDSKLGGKSNMGR